MKQNYSQNGRPYTILSLNKGQTNLAKGDITLLSYMPGNSTRHAVHPS